MNLKFSFLIYFSFIISYSVAQDMLLIKGKIIDSITSQPIAYVSVFQKNTSHGVISNEDGEFQFNINVAKNDSISFTSISYTTLTLPSINFISNNANRIVLSPSMYSLKEVMIKPTESAKEIVKKTIENIKNNYCVEPFIIDGYYREYQKENNQFKRLIEANVSVYDKGYLPVPSKIFSGETSEEFKILAFKKTTDSISCSPEYKRRNYLERLFASNIIKYYEILLNIKETDDYSFKIDSITYFENEPYFVISFTSEKENKNISGVILINKNSYAILTIKISLINKKTIDFTNGITYKYLPFINIISFRKYENKFFVNYIKTYSGSETVHKDSTQNCKFECYREFMTDVIKNKNVKPFNKKEAMAKKKDLYLQYENYNSNYFKSGDIMPLTESQKEIEYDLMKQH